MKPEAKPNLACLQGRQRGQHGTLVVAYLSLYPVYLAWRAHQRIYNLPRLPMHPDQEGMRSIPSVSSLWKGFSIAEVEGGSCKAPLVAQRSPCKRRDGRHGATCSSCSPSSVSPTSFSYVRRCIFWKKIIRERGDKKRNTKSGRRRGGLRLADGPGRDVTVTRRILNG